MAKRYYISPIRLVPHLGWEPTLLDYPGNVSAKMPPQNPDGTMPINFCLCIVGTNDHTALLADSTLTDLPDVSLDATLSTIPTAKRNAILSKLQSLGVDTSTLTLQTAYRRLVRVLGRRIDDTFDENAFDCFDQIP